MNGERLWPKGDAFSQGILAALPESEWKANPGLFSPASYDRKSRIFSENHPTSHIFILADGLAKTYKNPSQDRVQIINILSAGDVIGSEALTRGRYNESASALTRCLIFKSEKNAFKEFMSRRPGVAVAMIRLLNRETERIQSLVCDLGTKKALPRVATCLLLIMEKQVKQGEIRPFNLPISRQEIGAFLGLSPETVSRQLKDLTTSKVIRLEHRRLTVLDLTQLKAIANA